MLWLSTRIVDAANHDRENPDGIKVGGHQASSASMVTAMTALWFAHLDAADRVAVKPHASPVFHAIQYLLGNLDRSYLTTLARPGRPPVLPEPHEGPRRGGLLDRLGRARRRVAALRRASYAAMWTRTSAPVTRSRFVAFVGDAELDEGNIWEAIVRRRDRRASARRCGSSTSTGSRSTGSSPAYASTQWRGQFQAAGWHVVEVEVRRRLQRGVRPARAERRCGTGSTRCPTSTTSRCSDCRATSCASSSSTVPRPAVVDAGHRVVDDDELTELVTDLGGHSLTADARRVRPLRCGDGPAVGRVRLHRQGLGAAHGGQPAQPLGAAVRPRRSTRCGPRSGSTPATEWDRFDASTPAGILCNQRREALRREPREPAARRSRCRPRPAYAPRKPVSTQEAFGRVLVDLRATTRLRRTSSRPPRTSPRRPTWRVSSTGSGSSRRRSGGRGATTPCSSGPRARPVSTSSSASPR